MHLTSENYYSKEANMFYMSVSQYKHWLECEAATIANLKGEFEPEEKDVFIVGNYLHAWCESPEAFEKYCEKYQDFIFKKRGGGKYAAYEKADEMIDVLRNDPKVMFYLQGDRETILTAELFGVPWKIRIDVDNPGLNYLLDLKTTRSITEGGWVSQDGKNVKVSFVEQWGYMIQAAVYSEIERIARGRDDHRDFHIVAVSKERVPDHSIIDLTDPVRLQDELGKIQLNLPRILAVKSGAEKPDRCECCDYCKATKRVGKIIHYTELMGV